MTALRLVEGGRASPLRSQTLWHALAHGVSESGGPTLSFVQPDRPYACLGYHRRLSELDLDYCRQARLPVLRRMVGGGPVYLDDGQLFFQIILPLAAVPASRVVALRTLLSPAVQAFRDCGVDAQLRDGEICVGDRKICGHGAGQIEAAVVVCGNLIRRFDYPAATRILRLPDAASRVEVERLMRRYVAATPVDPEQFRSALTRRYAETLQLSPRPGTLTEHEQRELDRLDRQFADADWLQGPSPGRAGPIQIKIREGVRVAYARQESTSVLVSSVNGHIVHAQVRSADPAGRADLERLFVGSRLDQLAPKLRAALPDAPEMEQIVAELAA